MYITKASISAQEEISNDDIHLLAERFEQQDSLNTYQTPFNNSIPIERKPRDQDQDSSHRKSLFDLEHDCLVFMSERSFPIDKIVIDDSWQRLSVDGGKDEDEWYIARSGNSKKGNPWLMCTFGTFAKGFQIFGTYKSWEQDKAFSDEERESVKKEFSEWEQKNKNRKLAEEAGRIRKARDAWDKSLIEPADQIGHLGYLSRKKVKAYGVRFSYDWFNDGTKKDPIWNKYPTLTIPLRNYEGDVQGIQNIREDGKKRIYGPKTGNFHVLGSIVDMSPIYVAEGYSTAASVYEATGIPTVIAVDCGNLQSVVESLHKKYPKNTITIAADDDVETDGNPGRTKAEAVAKKFRCKVAFPTFAKDFRLPPNRDGEIKSPTDWNDLHVYFGLEKVQEQIKGTALKLEPLPLQREIGAPEPFPVHELGALMQEVALKIIKISKVADSICGSSLLAMASLCVQAHRDVCIDGRKSPLSEFFLTVATSGDRKSTADRIALSAIRKHESEVLGPLYKSEYKVWENNNEAYLAQKQKLIRLCPDNLKAELENLIKPQKPLDPIILCEDPSIAGLELLYYEGLPSIGLFTDEGARFFGGFSMSKENVMNSIGWITKLWDGDPPSRVRKDQRFRLYGRRLSAHLMIQPTIYNQICGNQVISNQGILARFLTISPPCAGDTGPYNPTNLSQDAHILELVRHCEKILREPFPLKAGSVNELNPLTIEPSIEAKKIWQSFYEEIESELGPTGRYRPVYALAKKIAEHSIRIAGIIEVFYNLRSTEISAKSMKSGVEIARWYLREGVRIIGATLISEELELAQRTLEFLQKRAITEGVQFPLWIIYKDGPNAVRNKQTSEKIIRILADHGRVSPVAEKKNWWELL